MRKLSAPPRAITELAITMSYEGGTSNVSSWGAEVDQGDSDQVVKRFQPRGTPAWGAPDDSAGGWAFFVRNPMGITVEVFAAG